MVNIHDRSSAGPGEYFDIYDFVVDDVNVMQYFIDTYGVTGNIVLQGNSRGTMASALVIKALAGQAYNPQNQKKDAGLEETSKMCIRDRTGGGRRQLRRPGHPRLYG